MNVILFSCAGVCYAVAAAAFFLQAAGGLPRNREIAGNIMRAGCVVQAAAYAARWIETVQTGLDQTPLSLFTLYESLVFAAWAMAVLYVAGAARCRVSMPERGAGAALIAALLMGYATCSNNVNAAVQELPAVLRGNLFIPHAIASTAAFSAFLLACVDSTLILLRGRSLFRRLTSGRREPDEIAVLDDLNYTEIAVGFFLYTVGFATGVYRCRVIWGKYWSWDPSEISSLIVWVLYALILHGRYQHWWRPRMTAALTLVAFAVACLCFVISARIIMASRHYPIQ